MKDISALEDKLPYIIGWIIIFIVFVILAVSYLYLFSKKHPEIFQDYKEFKKQSIEQRRRIVRSQRVFHNVATSTISITFLWMAGLLLVVFGFKLGENEAALLVFMVLVSILSLGGLQTSNPKKETKNKKSPKRKNKV